MGIRIVRAAATILSIAVLAPAAARANDLNEVQGAWAVEDMECADVFVASDGRMALKKREDDTLPGFIVDGDSVRGVGGACRIAAFKARADGISVLLACRSQITVGNLKLTVKVPDPNTLIQWDPEFPDLTTRYHRCH